MIFRIVTAQTFKVKKFFLGTSAFLFVTSLALVFVVLPIVVANALPPEIHLTNNEFAASQPIYLPRGRFVTQTTNHESAVGEDDPRFVQIKLFGLIPIRKIKVEILPFDTIYAGGQVIGFMAKIDGVVVTADAPEHKLKKGDIIKSINNEPVVCVTDFHKILKKNNSMRDIPLVNLSLDVQRGEKFFEREVQFNGDCLGLWIKDETSGVGTLTYINPHNNNFASLGHRLNDFETGVNVDLRGGTVHGVGINGIERSHGKKIGIFKSSMTDGNSKQGDILSSNFSGVFGCLYTENEFREQAQLYPVSSRYNVKPGKAKLRTTLCGEVVREFDIEIIKTRFQKKPSAKSMVVRITCPELLRETGGIIHGMSHG